MLLNNQDSYNKYRALKKVLEHAKHELKGDAIKSVASLFLWFDNLEEIFKPKPPEAKDKTPKPLEDKK